MIVQPRTLNSNDGNESYSIPPNLLDDDVIITSCEIRGCYELYDLFATGSYWTNTLSVTCEATGGRNVLHIHNAGGRNVLRVCTAVHEIVSHTHQGLRERRISYQSSVLIS